MSNSRYIKEDYDRLSNETIPRKYFSGGIDKLTNVTLRRSSSPVEESKSPKYKMGVGISPQGGKSDILTILAKMSKTARALALAAAITCTGAGCADHNDNSVKDVQVKQEVYFYRTGPNSEREYSEVQTNENITLRVAGPKQEMFSGEWEVPLLVMSKKAFNKIHLVYQSGSGGIIAHRVNEYNLEGSFWRTEREVEIPFINGMNSVTLEFLDKNNQVVGFFEIKDFVDRLIQQNILPEKSRQIYLDFQKDKSSSPVRYEVYQADGNLWGEDIQDFDSRLKAMWDEKNQAGIMKNNVSLINRSEKGDFFITFKAGDPVTPISQERKEQSRVVKKDFNPEGFNFNKSFTIGQRLFELDLDGSRARVQVNIGPDFQHHFLVLPEAEKNHPQLIQPGHILTILKLLALSTADNIKFGHNSWGAGAAVNHLHIHGIYYPKGAFSIERAATRHIASKASVNISEIVDYPAKGFVFESEEMSALAEVSGGFIKSLQDQNIPYNIVISRRGVYVLPREFGPTVIDGQELMLGYLEMAGEVGLSKDAFEHLSSLSQSQVQQVIADALWNATINNETFGELKKQLQSSSPILTDVVLPVLGIGIGTGILVKIWLDKTIQGNLLKLSAINTQASKNAFDKLVSFGYEALPAVEKRMQKVEDFARRLDRDNPLYQSSVDEYAVLSLLRDAIVQGKYKSSSPIFGGLFGSSKFQGEIIITDKAWKKAVLLLKVMESAQDGGKSLQSVQSKSLDWLGPQNSFKRTVALNVLRFLYKKGLINVDSSLRGQILTLFQSDSSVAVKLAALDFLGAVGMSFNPLDDLSPMDVSKIVKFREIILKKGNDSRKYESLEVFSDIKRLSSGGQNENDPQKLLNKIILEVEREGVPAQSSSPITPQEARAMIKGKLLPEQHDLINDTHVDLAMAYEGNFEAVYHPGPPEGIEIIRGEKLDQSSPSTDLGGIDMNAIDLDRQGAGVDIQFDPAELQDIIDVGIDGFAPVIINITPLPSVLPLLGLDPANKEDPLEVSVL